MSRRWKSVGVKEREGKPAVESQRPSTLDVGMDRKSSTVKEELADVWDDWPRRPEMVNQRHLYPLNLDFFGHFEVISQNFMLQGLCFYIRQFTKFGQVQRNNNIIMSECFNHNSNGTKQTCKNELLLYLPLWTCETLNRWANIGKDWTYNWNWIYAKIVISSIQ